MATPRDTPIPFGGARLWRGERRHSGFCGHGCGQTDRGGIPAATPPSHAPVRFNGSGETDQRGAVTAARLASAALAAAALAIACVPSQPLAGAGTLTESSGCGSTVKVWIASL